MAVPTNKGPVKASHTFGYDETNNKWTATAVTASGAASVSIAPPSTLASGQNVVAAAGTAEPVSAVSMPVLGITITANRTNTGNIYVGDSAVDSSNGLILRRNASVFFDIDNLDDIYVDVDTNGEGYSYLAVKF